MISQARMSLSHCSSWFNSATLSHQSSRLLPLLRWLQMGRWKDGESIWSCNTLRSCQEVPMSYLTCLMTNMNLSALAKRTRLNWTTCTSRNFPTSFWHFSKAGGRECNTCFLLRGGGTVCWRVTEALHFITYPFITMSPKCLRFWTLGTLYQVYEGSEFLRLSIRKWSQPAMVHDVVWLSYYMSWAPGAAS